MGVGLGAAACALVFATAATAAAPGTQQRFKSIIRTQMEVPRAYPPNSPAGATVFVATDANEADFFRVGLTDTANRQLDEIKFEHRFLIGVLLTAKTSGYKATIGRIGLQKLGGNKRQFCIRAEIAKPKPRQPVVNHLWFAMHIVSLSADPYRIDEFHWNVPKAWVLRDTRGKLLGVSHEGTNQRGKPITTGTAKACRA